MRLATLEDIPCLVACEDELPAHYSEPLGEVGFRELFRRRWKDVRAYSIQRSSRGVLFICGGLVYTLKNGEGEIISLAYHPTLRDDVGRVLLLCAAHLRARARKKHCSFTLNLRDRDQTGLRQLLPFWKLQGVNFRLCPDLWGDDDVWQGTLYPEE